jgi:hypothetical protein
MHVRRFNIYSGHHTVQVTAAPCPPFTSDFIALYWVAVPRGLHPLRPSIHLGNGDAVPTVHQRLYCSLLGRRA